MRTFAGDSAAMVEPHSVTEPESISSLPIEPFEPAVLRLATGRFRSPLFVITHGAGGNAEWHCDHYAALLGPDGTLVCLRGKRMYANDESRGYYYPSHLELGKELRRAREAVIERYPERIERSAVYIRYSQGATMGVLAVADHGDWFPRLLLVEGGFDGWSGALAERYAETGGRRVLFVCGTEHCRRQANASVTLLRQHRIEAQLRVAPGAGHRPDGPVTEQVRQGLHWLLEGPSDQGG